MLLLGPAEQRLLRSVKVLRATGASLRACLENSKNGYNLYSKVSKRSAYFETRSDNTVTFFFFLLLEDVDLFWKMKTISFHMSYLKHNLNLSSLKLTKFSHDG